MFNVKNTGSCADFIRRGGFPYLSALFGEYNPELRLMIQAELNHGAVTRFKDIEW
jgi:hypothetical protein